MEGVQDSVTVTGLVLSPFFSLALFLHPPLKALGLHPGSSTICTKKRRSLSSVVHTSPGLSLIGPAGVPELDTKAGRHNTSTCPVLGHHLLVEPGGVVHLIQSDRRGPPQGKSGFHYLKILHSTPHRGPLLAGTVLTFSIFSQCCLKQSHNGCRDTAGAVEGPRKARILERITYLLHRE